MINYNKELSIQITLSGFSFQIDTPSRKGSGFAASYDIDSVVANCADFDSVVEWSNTDVMIMPIELFDSSIAAEYLTTVGMLDEYSQRVMYRVDGEFVVLWSVSGELYDYISLKLPAAEHTHSLLELIVATSHSRQTIAVDLDNAGVMHIVVWGDSILLEAISVQITSPEDMLFYMRKLSSHDTMMQYDLLLASSVDKQYQSLLGQYYRNIFLIENK